VDRSAAWQSWVGGRFNNFRGNLQLRPNAVPGQRYGPACAASNGRVPCPGGMGFNPGAFSSVPGLFADPTQVLGTLGRNVMRGSGAWQINFALHRQFNFTDRIHLQFWSEKDRSIERRCRSDIGSCFPDEINSQVGKATATRVKDQRISPASVRIVQAQ
jgi:hypothetical protein